MRGDRGGKRKPYKSPYIHPQAPGLPADHVTDTSYRTVANRQGFYPIGQTPVHSVPPDEVSHQKPDFQPGKIAKAVVGKSLYNLVTTGHTSDPWGAALETGMLLPFGKLFGVGRAVKAAEAAKAADAVVPVAKTAAAQVREALPGAKIVRGKQDVLYSAERGVRAGKAESAMQIGGQAGHKAALGQLKGELPKISFNGLRNLDQNTLDELFTTIQTHPTLRTFEKVRAQTGLLKTIEGQTPTRSEIDLMETVFGKDTTGSLRQAAKGSALKNLAFEVWNIPRSLQASFDLSAPFRQGLVAGVRYPKIFFPNFKAMVKSFGSEKVYQSVQADILARPTHGLMQKAKLAVTDLEHEGNLSTREEQFAFSNLGEKIPVAGRGVRASGRAYTAFLNKTRADVFDHLIQKAQQQGLNVNDPKFLESLGRFINSATGRGDLGALSGHAVTLNALMFSPRLLASRLNFLNPVYYVRLDPFARKEALKAAFGLVGMLSMVLELARAGGATVNSDPRNADFAKIRIGHTRVDLAGGFAQPIRLLAEVSPGFMGGGKIISSTTGKTLSLGPQGPGKLSRADIIQRFGESKLNPSIALAWGLLKGRDFQGQPYTVKKTLVNTMVPLLAQDVWDLYHDSPGSLPPGLAALLGGAIGSVGFGIQTYGPSKPKKSRRRSGGSRGSGGSPYLLGPSDSAGGSPYLKSPGSP